MIDQSSRIVKLHINLQKHHLVVSYKIKFLRILGEIYLVNPVLNVSVIPAISQKKQLCIITPIDKLIILRRNQLYMLYRLTFFFLQFTYENTKAQKHLLGAMEALVSQHRSFLLKRVPHILKCFYDNDLVEEECILDWDTNPSTKYVPDLELQTEMRKSATIFTKWLREAENDSGSDYEAVDDDIKVEFAENNNIENGTQLKVEIVAANHVATPVTVEDNDLDDFIDNI